MGNKIKNFFKHILEKVGFHIDDTMKMWVGEVTYKIKQPDGTFREVKATNKVLLGGLQIIAWFLFRKPFAVKIKSFEQDLYEGAAVDWTNNLTIDKQDPEWAIQGFNLLIDGSVGTDVVPYEKHKKGYDFDSLIPWRVVPEADNNYAEMFTKYAHARVKIYRDSSGREHRYVEYFTKRNDIPYSVKTDNHQDVPDLPDENLETDKDIRVVGNFNIQVEEEELREWFSLTKKGKMEATHYNAVSILVGKKATLNIDGTNYSSCKDSYFFSRVNHIMIAHGVDGSVLCVYKIRLI